MNLFDIFGKIRTALAMLFGLANRVARVEEALHMADAVDFSKDDILEEGHAILEAAREIDAQSADDANEDGALEHLNRMETGD